MATICLYASKPCLNPRSIKDDGELHRLCLDHRARANSAQRRWHSRQRDGAAKNESKEVTTPSLLSSPPQSAPARRRRRARSLNTKTQRQHAVNVPSVLDMSSFENSAAATHTTEATLDSDNGIIHACLDDDDLAYLGELLLRLDEASTTSTTTSTTTTTTTTTMTTTEATNGLWNEWYEPTAIHTGVENDN